MIKILQKSWLVIAVLAGMTFFSTAAFAETRQFNNPTVSGIPLDWCYTWASSCGKPAADYYCRRKGYNRSVGHGLARDIGYTKILRTGQICNAPYCDGFRFIRCYRPGAAPGPSARRFNYPRISGYRLDWCRRWAQDCGRGAANMYCRRQGYSRASSWAIDPDIGIQQPTKVIQTGQICNQGFCDGFRYIRCVY